MTEKERLEQQNRFESQQDEGYQKIAELKKRQRAELQRVKRLGENQKKELGEYYRDSINTTQADGTEKLKDLNLKNHEQMKHFTRQHNFEVDTLKKQTEVQVAATQALVDQRLKDLKSLEGKQIEKIEANQTARREQTIDRFEKNYNSLVDSQKTLLNSIYSDVSNKIADIKLDSARKLDAYSDRQDDPFYQLVDINASVDEDSKEYIVRANVPEHAQEQLSINIQGNNLVLTGNRQSEEEIEVAPGQFKRTTSFQTFSESIPLNYPVNANQVSREFDGDELIVRIPKAATYASPVFQRPKPTDPQISKPNFPDGLKIDNLDELTAEKEIDESQAPKEVQRPEDPKFAGYIPLED